MGSESVATPLCHAGHLPHKGGDWMGAPASLLFGQRHRFPGIPGVGLRAKRRYYPISPLVGEMPGRAEGGITPENAHREDAMSHIPVPPRHRTNAKRMRSSMTEAELKLWNELRAHRLMGLGFRRQVPITGYIVDFACPTHRLIVEVDGSQHGNDVDLHYDDDRTRRLEQDGWTVLRFWNDDVLKGIDNVCMPILAVLKLT